MLWEELLDDSFHRESRRRRNFRGGSCDDTGSGVRAVRAGDHGRQPRCQSGRESGHLDHNDGSDDDHFGRCLLYTSGLPVSVPGTTINRYCASGLQAISVGAQRIIVDGASAVVAGGVESISMVQTNMNVEFFTEDWMLRHDPDVYMPMLQTRCV